MCAHSCVQSPLLSLIQAVFRCCSLQFHKWHAELEAAYASEMEEKFKRYADLLNSHRQSCEDILAKVGAFIGELVMRSCWDARCFVA